MRTAQSLAVGALWLAAGFLLGWSGAAQATNWARPAVSGAGDWNNENNWSPVRVPGRDASNDEGWVNNGGTCDVTANPLFPFRQLHVISGSTLNVQTGATIGWSDFGEVNSGGVINTYGTAVMSGVMVVQGTGVFNQWGGTVQVNGLGGGGTYNLKNGTAATPLFGALTMANGNNTFNQDNGTMSVDRVVALGYGTGTSSYNLNGGVFNQIYGDRPFQVGGWNYDGGGFTGTGAFIQGGGTANIGADIYLGLRAGTGTYSLSNGTLNSTSMHIGDVPSGGTGIFNLSGGSISLTGGISFNTDVGNQFNWTGGTLKAASFTAQAGGQLLQTSTAASSLLDVTANSMTVSGDYTIQGSGSSASIGVGRILSVTGTVSLRDGAAINGPGALTAAAIDARSGSISAPIGGAAALTKSTAGTVLLTGSNSYSGGTNVTGGILQGNSASLPGNVTLSNNAGLLFDQASDGNFNGVIGGNGSVTKQSAGKLILSAAQS